MQSLGVAGHALVIGDPQANLAASLTEAGVAVSRWDRRVQTDREAASWCPAGPFDLVAIRLPRAKEELAMVLHAAAGVLKESGSLLLFGANDEGIKSIAGRLEPLFANVRTVAKGSHCRVLAAAPSNSALTRTTLADWRTTFDPRLEELGAEWVSYPGVFSHGSLDNGSRLLIGALPPTMAGISVLDYGAGTGPISGVCRMRGADVAMLDVDTVALEAARENVPGAAVFAASSLAAVPSEVYSAIVSNPPIHRGKAETHDVLEALIEGAPDCLAKKGSLYLVVQKRLNVETLLDRCFKTTDRIAEDQIFKVLRAQ